MKLKKLHIFLNSGRTFTFQDVHIIHDNESVLVFGFTAMSDGNIKEATFYKTQIVGVSMLKDKNELPF